MSGTKLVNRRIQQWLQLGVHHNPEWRWAEPDNVRGLWCGTGPGIRGGIDALTLRLNALRGMTCRELFGSPIQLRANKPGWREWITID